MRYALPVATFLIAVMLNLYYLPPFAIALESSSERCDSDTCYISITEDGFVPKTLIVKLGTTIIWTNMDDRRHTVTSGSPDAITEPLKSKILEKKDTYEFTFEYSGFYHGSYQYFDQITRIMTGEIIIESASKTTGETEEKVAIHPIKIDFRDPESGVKNFSFPSGNITSMEINPNATSLIITVTDVRIIDKLEITLDRNLIDAKKPNGKDANFQIAIDGHSGFYEEISSTATERTLQIVVPANALKIELIGTQVLPDRMNASAAISEADKIISDYESEGIVVSSATSKLNDAKLAFATGKYTDAESLANDAKTIANNVNQNATLAKNALSEAESAAKESSNLGYNVSSARQLLDLAGKEYSNGNYEKATDLAQQAKSSAIDARNTRISSPVSSLVSSPVVENTKAYFGQTSFIAGAIILSLVGGVGIVSYMRSRRNGMERTALTTAEPIAIERRIIDLNKIFTDKPHLRDDDRSVISYIAEKQGTAFESEIREKFNLPRTTTWRLVKRLVREGVIEVRKAGGQNLIRINDEFAKDQNSSQGN